MEDTYEKYLIKKASLNHTPVTTTFELTPLCNMNCSMCYVRRDKSEMTMEGRIFTIEEWLDVARQMAAQGTLFVLLTGGEPLLFPEFQRLYLELKNLGMIVSVNTNATLIDREWADFFARHKPRRLNITLYGSSEETYAGLCHYPDGFRRAMNGIELLKERGIDIKINSSMTKVNQGDFEEIYRIGEKLGMPVFTDAYMLPGRRERTKPFAEQTRLSPEEAARMEWKVLQKDMSPEQFNQYVRSVLMQIREEGRTYPAGFSCQATLCSCTVDWKGCLRPCVTLEEPSVDLRRYSFREAWEMLANEAQSLCVNDKCCSCSLRPICQTCVGSARVETGQYDGVSPYLCRHAEELFRLFQERGERLKDESDI